MDAKYSSKTIRSIFTGGMVEIVSIRLVFAQILQMLRGPTGTDRGPLSVATDDYVADRSAEYENQTLFK